MGDRPGLFVNRQALQMNPARKALLVPEQHLTGLPPAARQDLLPMPMERGLMTRCHHSRERLSDQRPPVDAEQGPGPQIGLLNRALSIQREVAGRGKIVEIHITIARRFECQLSPAQLLVLHLQLDLMDLQLLHELLHVLDRHGGHVAISRPEEFLRLSAKRRGLRGSVWFLGHRSTPV